MEHGVTIKAEHTKILREDKTEGTFAITATPFPHAQGYIIAFLVDVTTQVNIETQLMEAKLIVNTEHIRSKFVAITSHELRNPVNGVIGLCELLLLEDNLTDRQREYAMDIRDCSMKLCDIINMLLFFRQLDDNKVELDSHDSKGWLKTHGPTSCLIYCRCSRRSTTKYVVRWFPDMSDSEKLTQQRNQFVCVDGRIRLSISIRIISTGKRLIQFRVFNDGTKISDERYKSASS